MRSTEAACSGRKDRQRAMPAALAALHHQVERFVPGGGSRTGWHELAAQRPCGGPYACGHRDRRAAGRGDRPHRPWSGQRAWRFTVAGLGWKVSEVAVARDALVVLPGYVPIPRAGQNTPRVNGLTAVSADGRTLTLSFTGSACDAAWGAYRYESNGTVVAGGGRSPPQATRRARPWACPAPPA